jgi:8-amino-7-oxononanoate synthase
MSQAADRLESLIEALLDQRRTAHRLRSLTSIQPLNATHVKIGGRRYVNFASNDYLGLSKHPRVAAAVEGAVREYGFGSGASALISGHTPAHESAARAIAAWKQTEAAVLLPSGYQANFAAVQTLAAIARQSGREFHFFADKLVHASILDALRGGKLDVRVFPHNNLAQLRRRLARSGADDLNVVVTESIFSMDGDAADLHGLAELKREQPFVLMLDEAHASGVYGPAGAGLAHELGLQGAVDISVVTLSKALGAIGGAICAGRRFCDAVVNFGRAYIYTTSPPAAAAAAAEAAIEVLRDEPARQKRLRDLSRDARKRWADAGVAMPPGDSPILCVLLGSEEATLEAWEKLRNQGLLVGPVRPPTVAPGSSRLRATLCCEHSDEEVQLLVSALIDLFKT